MIHVESKNYENQSSRNVDEGEDGGFSNVYFLENYAKSPDELQVCYDTFSENDYIEREAGYYDCCYGAVKNTRYRRKYLSTSCH